MFSLKELLSCSDDSTYERSEIIKLLEIEDYDSCLHTNAEIEKAVKEKYNTSWCNCAHDCCGHWKFTVSKIAVDRIYRRVIVYINATQNV